MVRRLPVLLLLLAVLAGCVRGDVEYLAADASDGRNNNTTGSARAQGLLLSYLKAWTEGANSQSTGDNAYRQPFDLGTNLVGVIPGSDLADEYVLLGAHYDHVGHGCRDLRAGDDICNGATDNATSVAAILQVVRGLAYAPEPPRRSVIVAFWDREEDGLIGSRFYAQNPLIPIEDTVAYVNLDILGANLRPSLRDFSFAIGGETGGPRLKGMVQQSIAGSSLGTRQLSVLFGQGRSDHVSLINVGVPTVFFGDATGPCYHTDSDDIAVVDFDKLDRQIGIIGRLVRDLATTNVLPTFSTGNPVATYDDAVVLTDAVDALQADLALFPPATAAQLVNFRTQLHAIVDAGPAAFDSADINQLLSIAASSVSAFTQGQCDGYLAQP